MFLITFPLQLKCAYFGGSGCPGRVGNVGGPVVNRAGVEFSGRPSTTAYDFLSCAACPGCLGGDVERVGDELGGNRGSVGCSRVRG